MGKRSGLGLVIGLGIAVSGFVGCGGGGESPYNPGPSTAAGQGDGVHEDSSGTLPASSGSGASGSSGSSGSSGAAGGSTAGDTKPSTSQPSDSSASGAPSGFLASKKGMACGKNPTRYVMLGHSVAHCFRAGGVNSEACASKGAHSYLKEKFPDITYENVAVDGALIEDILTKQLPNVKPGPGHVFVNVFIGGNDLAAHLYETDADAQKSWEKLRPKAIADVEKIFAFFEDRSKFPDGATALLNTQYNPFDECVAGAYTFVSELKQAKIREFNDEIFKIATAHSTAVAADQYTTFLGHGHNYNKQTCPRFVGGADKWMADLIHANEKGHVNLLAQMKQALDAIYDCK